MRTVHTAAHFGMTRAGYQWDLRRSGDLKLGLWRKTFRKVAHPRRFVVIPGWGDTPISWLGPMILMRSALRANYDEIVIFDFPGFQGFLSKEKCFPTMEAFFSATHDALDSLKPHTVLGHSLGGWLAASYAGFCGKGDRPHKPSSTYEGPETLIVLCPSGVFPDSESIAEWESKFLKVMNGEFDTLKQQIFKKPPIWFKLIEKEYHRFLSRKDIHEFLHTFKGKETVGPLLPYIKANTWVIWGEHDELIPTRWASSWLQALEKREGHPRAPAILIKGSGHSPQIEKMGATASLLSQVVAGKYRAHSKRWIESR